MQCPKPKIKRFYIPLAFPKVNIQHVTTVAEHIVTIEGPLLFAVLILGWVVFFYVFYFSHTH